MSTYRHSNSFVCGIIPHCIIKSAKDCVSLGECLFSDNRLDVPISASLTFADIELKPNLLIIKIIRASLHNNFYD